ADDELIAGYFGTGRRWLFDFAIEALLHEGKAAEAFDYAERARARAFLQLIGNHRLSPGRGGNERLVREAEALRTRIAEWERAGSAIPTDLANARREYRTLIGRLKTTNLEYASLARVEPLSVEAIRQEIPAGTTVISYFVSVQGLHAWVLDEKNLVHVALPGEPAAVQRAACWAMQFGNGRLRGPKPRTQRCAVPATAEDVYDLLIRPLRGKIGNARLIIIPHGVLHYVPFAALRDRTNGRYLIEDYTFTLAPSASALRFLRAKETPVTGRALVLGNPDSRMGALPGAQREAIAVARAFGTTPLLGPAAAESLLYGLHGEVDLLHISAHARYDDAAPTFSRIGLAAGRGHDGNLEVHEILADVDLTGVNLVVLSACETAVGQRSGGDDVVSLTRAILYAGSPGVISTLWAIDDQAAARLMEEFYRRLLDGLPAADALRAAQLALLHDKTNNEPKFWAAFTLTGNPSATWKRGAAAGPR
ncbi:MAG TPA: CHAT domain-containing protein, partial [Thermoanaerobaculia bacterium]